MNLILAYFLQVPQHTNKETLFYFSCKITTSNVLHHSYCFYLLDKKVISTHIPDSSPVFFLISVAPSSLQFAAISKVEFKQINLLTVVYFQDDSLIRNGSKEHFPFQK